MTAMPQPYPTMAGTFDAGMNQTLWPQERTVRSTGRFLIALPLSQAHHDEEPCGDDKSQANPREYAESVSFRIGNARTRWRGSCAADRTRNRRFLRELSAVARTRMNLDQTTAWLDAHRGEVVNVSVKAPDGHSVGFFQGELGAGTRDWVLINANDLAIKAWDVGSDAAFMLKPEEFVSASYDDELLHIELEGLDLLVHVRAT